MTFAAAAKLAIGLLAVGMTAGVLALAAAAPPSAGNDSGTTIIELAATDGPSSAPLATPAVEPQQVLAAVSGEAPTGQLSVVTTAPVAENTTATAAPAAGLPGQPRAGARIATPALTTTPPAQVAASTPAADGSQLPPPAPAGTLSVDGGAINITAPAGALTLQSATVDPTVASTAPAIAPPQVASSYSYANSVQTTAPSTTSSRAAIEIELHYWTLKASGLSKKAEALKLKAQSINATTDAERVEVLEIESEAELTLAEVKHCEAMAQQLKDDLSRPSQPAQTFTAPVPGIPGAAPPVTEPPVGGIPTAPQPAGDYAPPQLDVAQARTPLTPQNTYVVPVNPPVGPGATSPYVPGGTAAVQQQVQALSNELDALRAMNQRLQERVQELEGEHESAAR